LGGGVLFLLGLDQLGPRFSKELIIQINFFSQRKTMEILGGFSKKKWAKLTYDKPKILDFK